MENLPFVVSAGCILTTALTLFLLYKAANYSKTILTVSLAWLGLQATVALAGFYTVTDALPPRFTAALLPPLVVIVALFATRRGRNFIDGLQVKWLTLLHVVRVPVELLLLWLALHKYLPLLMTFDGRNFDVLSGLTAPIVFYFGFVKRKLRRNFLLGWNFACLALLLN
ncbi:MAG TPA: hypothetical protein VM871_00380, partial [Flavisolibacter sp.]|nr:hypothetical protein [Flavisolibacter sp.]